MNNLFKPTSTVHPVQRKKLAHIKEIQKRNKKAQAYLDLVVPKLKKFNK